MRLSPEFADNILKQIGLEKSDEAEKFIKLMISGIDRYSFLKLINGKIDDFRKQKRLWKKYNNAVKRLQSVYDELRQDRVCESALSIALRGEYVGLNVEEKSRLQNYVNDSGRVESLYPDILSLHVKASSSPLTNTYKSEKDILQQWLVFCRNNWPEKASIKFALGDYLAEVGEYKSPSCDLLYELITKVDSTVERTYLTSLMREIIEKNITQSPAYSV